VTLRDTGAFVVSTDHPSMESVLDSKDKHETVARYLKGARKIKSREEQRLIDEHTRARKQGQERRPPRQREWSQWDEDEDVDLFESMRSGDKADLSGTTPAQPLDLGCRNLGLDRGLLIAPRGARAIVRAGGVDLDVQVEDRLRAGGALVVGDEVILEAQSEQVLRIVGRTPRRSELLRRDPGSARGEKVIAANVDLGVIVLAAGGRRLKLGLVDRLWIALARGGIEPVVLVNKIDLAASGAQREELELALATWRDLGLEAMGTSALNGSGVDPLRAALWGKSAVFVGQSGVGKSSLLNGLDPDGARRVHTIRDGDGRGRHTTTASTLRELGDGTRLIDTPGVRAFGLPSLEVEDVLAAFPDVEALGRECRFADCSHGGEPDCAVTAATRGDGRLAVRLEAYRRILASLSEDL
jgi:ribosome biogenesis GTPase / thiamine phosphate phosphatase